MTPGGVAVAGFTQSISNTGDGIRMIANRFDGTAWAGGLRIDVPDAVIDAEHRAAVAPDGVATLVFNQSDNVAGRRATAALSVDRGDLDKEFVVGEPQARRCLVRVVRIVTGRTGMGSVRLRADAAGNAIAVWNERPTTRNEVHAARVTASSGTWSAHGMLNDGSAQAYEPELAMTDMGDALVVWTEASDSGPATGSGGNRFLASTSAWGGATRVQPTDASAGVSPHVALVGPVTPSQSGCRGPWATPPGWKPGPRPSMRRALGGHRQLLVRKEPGARGEPEPLRPLRKGFWCLGSGSNGRTDACFEPFWRNFGALSHIGRSAVICAGSRQASFLVCFRRVSASSNNCCVEIASVGQQQPFAGGG